MRPIAIVSLLVLVSVACSPSPSPDESARTIAVEDPTVLTTEAVESVTSDSENTAPRASLPAAERPSSSPEDVRVAPPDTT